jgi:hypothetical protein
MYTNMLKLYILLLLHTSIQNSEKYGYPHRYIHENIKLYCQLSLTVKHIRSNLRSWLSSKMNVVCVTLKTTYKLRIKELCNKCAAVDISLTSGQY